VSYTEVLHKKFLLYFQMWLYLLSNENTIAGASVFNEVIELNQCSKIGMVWEKIALLHKKEIPVFGCRFPFLLVAISLLSNTHTGCIDYRSFFLFF